MMNRLIAQGAWSLARVPQGLHVLMARPRRRKLQGLPSRGVALQHSPAALSEAASAMLHAHIAVGGWRL
jgi:hypothetical protein